MVGARTDLPLTAAGCEQAHQFAGSLLSEKSCLKAIYAGGLRRQIQTAEIIRQSLSIESPIRTQEAALTEIDYGAWEGLTQEEIIRLWPQEYAEWTQAGGWAKGVFGRSLDAHLSDIQNWISHLRSSYADGDLVVAVTSNGVLRFFYSLQEAKWLPILKERQMEKIKVKTGHFCELQIMSDSIEIQRWNCIPK